MSKFRSKQEARRPKGQKEGHSRKFHGSNLQKIRETKNTDMRQNAKSIEGQPVPEQH